MERKEKPIESKKNKAILKSFAIKHRSVCNEIKYHIKIMNIIINRITKPRCLTTFDCLCGYAIRKQALRACLSEAGS